MHRSVLDEVKEVIVSAVGGELTLDSLTDDLPLAGNILDSMAVTNLVLALEEHFGFIFDDEDLSAEAFETANSLSELVKTKIES